MNIICTGPAVGSAVEGVAPLGGEEQGQREGGGQEAAEPLGEQGLGRLGDGLLLPLLLPPFLLLLLAWRRAAVSAHRHGVLYTQTDARRDGGGDVGGQEYAVLGEKGA